MRQTERNQIVARVFAQVLETFAFLFTEPGEGVEPGTEELPEERYYEAEIHFYGPWVGKIQWVVGEAVCREISANVLGLDSSEELALEQLEDGAKEVLNIFCGNILTQLASPERIFDLTIPTLTEFNRRDWRKRAEEPETVRLLAEDKPVLLRFFLERVVDHAA